MSGEIFEIRNAHIATLHLLISYMASERAFKHELLIALSDATKYDIETIRKRIDKREKEFYSKLKDNIFKTYGIVDLDDLLSEDL